MNKPKFFRILSYLLIVMGVLFLLIPQFSYLKIDNRAEKSNRVAEQMSATSMQNNLHSETTFDFDSIEEISMSGTWLSPESIDQNLIIGRLYIPSINVNLTLFSGVSNSILHAGAGTMRPDLTFGEGNIPIAGHYSKDKHILFGNLTALKLGDRVFLTDNNKVYEYEVFETRIVDTTEVEWIEDAVAEEHGSPIVSLMNCYYVNGQNTGKRYFVFAELKGTVDLEDSVLN